MAEGRELPILLVWLLWTVSLTFCFNLEPRAALRYSYPYTSSEGRESYFGFSVALQHNEINNKKWLMVGAPRANSSYYHENQITEPGAMFKCDLRGATCMEFIVDGSGNTESHNIQSEYSYQDLKNYGWLGASLDSQPRLRDDRQVTGVCAPSWKNQLYYSPQQQHNQQYMNGVCYLFDDSDTYKTVKKLLPLVSYGKQTKLINNKRFYHYGLGQAGMSIHFPENQTSFIVGSPGVFNWHGSVILFEDKNFDNGGIIARRRRSISKRRMFTHQLVPDPYYISPIGDCDLFGYAVTSGKFLSNNILYVGGAPRGADSYGKVLVFDFPASESTDLLIMREFTGTQLGEYFGAALTAADVNGDGLTDLIVGSPMYSLPNHPDVGRIQTYLSSSKGVGLSISPEPHYGKPVSLARFGTSLTSPGDLNSDYYEDVVVGAPWEDDGAVYIFLGSATGLNHQYSQRLSPEDFSPGLRGFGMAMSRGVDIDENGYPDLAIGSFLSGHVHVIKTRPVAALSGSVTVNPPNVPWEGSATLNLTTCLQYKGRRIPRSSSFRVTVTLDHNRSAHRAVFRNNLYISNFTERLIANSPKPTCRTEQVTVKDDKIHPDLPMEIKLEYELLNNPGLQLIKQPMTNPREMHTNITRVGILKGCVEKTCKIDMKFDVDIDLGQGNKLVVGQHTKPVLRVVVFNSGEPVYLPTMTVKVDLPLTLILPPSHNCKFFDADVRTSLECELSNLIKMDSTDTVEVSVDASQLADGSSKPVIEVDVTGEGKELNPDDNELRLSLPLEAHANIELYGDSKEEQLFYKHVGEDRINATISPRFTHTYIVIKKGPTPLGEVDLNIDIPVSITDGQKLMRLYPPKTKFLHQPFYCKLNGGSFDVDTSDVVNQDAGILNDGNDKSGSDDIEPHKKSIIVSAGKEAEEGTQYFNCSSSLVTCAQLSCRIYNWPQDAESAKISFDLEMDLSVMAQYIGIKGGAVLVSTATASIQSLSSQLAFVGEKLASKEVVTYIQSDTLQGKGIPWWIILLAVLGGLLLLGLMAYGMYKAGFFEREKMDEMKAQRANLIPPKSYGANNAAHVGD